MKKITSITKSIYLLLFSKFYQALLALIIGFAAMMPQQVMAQPETCTEIAMSQPNLYIGNYATNVISRVSPNGSSGTTVSTLSGFNTAMDLTFAPEGSAFAGGLPFGRVLYVSLAGSHQIRKVTLDETGAVSANILFASVTGCYGLVFGPPQAPWNGDLFVSSAGNIPNVLHDGTISRVTSEGIISTFASSAIRFGTWQFLVSSSAANNGEGALFVSAVWPSGGPQAIDKIDKDGNIDIGWVTTPRPEGMAFDADGNLFVVNALWIDGNNFGPISKVTPDGTVSVLTDESGTTKTFNFAVSITFDPEGYLYVGEVGTQRILRLTLDGSTITDVCTYATGIVQPRGMAFGPSSCATPTITCPGNQSANTASNSCDAVVTYTTSSTGDPGPAITYVFEGATTGSGSGDGSGSTFNTGTTTVTLTATNDCGTESCSFDVIVTDNEAPVFTTQSGIMDFTVWPPNHKYETFTLEDFIVSVADNCAGDIPLENVTILSATSDEPENSDGTGDGNTLVDMIIDADCQTIQLRKERAGGGNGRVYTIIIAVDDGNGNFATATAQVEVPHSNNGTAIDDGMAYEVECNKSSFVSFAGDNVQLMNYPNPFNSNTTIAFSLTETENTTLKVYDTFGKEVATLFDGMAESGQEYKFEFSSGNLSKGIYIYHLQSGNNVSVLKKMILMK